jgi:hypothetical protein
MAKFGGMSYAEMLQAILQAAEQRLEFSRVSSTAACIQNGVAAQPVVYMQKS